MPKYLDTHEMGTFSEEALRELQNAPVDEFGVTHHDIIFSGEHDKIWCVLDAPDEEAVRKHHEKAGIDLEWVTRVKSARN